jgi:hypothetical protein
MLVVLKLQSYGALPSNAMILSSIDEFPNDMKFYRADEMYILKKMNME